VGGRIIGIDLDVLDAAAADRLLSLTQGHLGATPLIRVGRAPKRLLVYRAMGIIPSRSIALSCGNIDIIGERRQFVAYGIHPDTKRPYHWYDGTGQPFDTPVDSLPEVELWQIEHLLATASTIYPAPPLLGRRRHSNESGDIVTHPGTGRVINGRDTYLRDLTLQHCSDRRRRSVDAIVRDVWDEFCQTADTSRPRSSTNRPWSIKDAQKKVTYTLRRIQEGKTKRASKTQRPPRQAPAVDKRGIDAFARLIATRVEAGQLSRATGKVAAFMLSELVEGQCTHSVEHIAKSTGLAESTVQLARRRLVENALWERALQLSCHHIAPYWPNTLAVQQAIEEYGHSTGGVYGRRPIPLCRDPLLRSLEAVNDDGQPGGTERPSSPRLLSL
jgi:hypothetical protein